MLLKPEDQLLESGQPALIPVTTSEQQYSSIAVALGALDDIYQCASHAQQLSELQPEAAADLKLSEHMSPEVVSLSLFLQNVPPHLLQLDEQLLHNLLVSVIDRRGPQQFYSLVWKGIKEALRMDDCDSSECFTAGQALLQVAASADCKYELSMKAAAMTNEENKPEQQAPPLEEPIISTCLEPEVDVILDDIQRNSTPSKRLWTLYSTVHIDVFDLVGEKIKKQALAAATFGDASLTSEDLAESQDDKPSFPNPAQRLLLCITSYNALCSCKGLKGLRVGQGPTVAAAVSKGASNGHEALKYVVSRLRLDILCMAALQDLASMQNATGRQLHALLVSIVELSAPMRPAPAVKAWQSEPQLEGGVKRAASATLIRSVLSDWQLGHSSLAALDEALLEVALPSASLGMTAQLVSLRACLGMPLSPALTRLVEDAVLLQASGTEATARLLGLIQDAALAEEVAKECGDDEECREERMAAESTPPLECLNLITMQNSDEKDRCAIDEARLSELESLSSLFDVSCGTDAFWADNHDSKITSGSNEVFGSGEVDGYEGCVDTELLLNKTYVALAMADQRVWDSPHFLFRVYPQLFQSCIELGAAPGDLLSEKYCSTLTSMLQQGSRSAKLHKVILNDVELLHAVATVLCQNRDKQHEEVDGHTLPLASEVQRHASLSIMGNVDVMHSFQSHCAHVLCEGLSKGFIRVKPWLRLLDVLVCSRVACPQLVAVLTWALAGTSCHQSPFGRTREEFLRICKLWYGLLPAKDWKHQSNQSLHVSLSGETSMWNTTGSVGTVSPASNAGLQTNLRTSILIPGVGILAESTLESCLKMARSVIDGDISVPTVSEWKLAVLTKFPELDDDLLETEFDAVNIN
ncbi:hypothetical protein CEUSTIGMA_g11068.t1 [Chlamydomonas eustigma]|uniref:Uncharacterized protein n=1 Tax=Chlamydomonas eustigma TaxID=1157962 RepID=A0A250XKP2_9CHLO|nr:hypothetical protein CEUSTIGMA_g11068.t1 [Chlamydomonas eustigma]|eukprot:GAX83644.1 hypothetical protein CEUSTIGMA_g11068.t1 [Chlamydomonas eustigma]